MRPSEPQFDELVREVLMDHYRRPRNRGSLAAPTLHEEGMNPVCGDEIVLEADIADGRIAEIAFSGNGCSISQASASMLTQRLQGETVAGARAVLERVRAMLVDGAPPASDLGDLEALEGVAKFPVRVKCAMLSWNVLERGLRAAEAA